MTMLIMESAASNRPKSSNARFLAGVFRGLRMYAPKKAPYIPPAMGSSKVKWVIGKVFVFQTQR